VNDLDDLDHDLVIRHCLMVTVGLPYSGILTTCNGQVEDML